MKDDIFELTKDDIEIINFFKGENLDDVFASAKSPSNEINKTCLGYNMNPITGIVGIRKFIKELKGGEGCNVIVSQKTSLERYEIQRAKNGVKRTQGYFKVEQSKYNGECCYKINYNHPENTWFQESRMIEDYVKEVKYKGKSIYLGLGLIKPLLGVKGSYFLLFPVD